MDFPGEENAEPDKPEEPKEPAESDKSEEYKGIYKDFLTNRLNEETSAQQTTLGEPDKGFTLAYMDDDDIPELIFSYGTYHAAGVDIFKVENGELIKIRRNGEESEGSGGSFGSNGCIAYAERKGYISSGYSGMGVTNEAIYTVEGAIVKEVSSFSEDWNDESNKKYDVNGKAVSESEYKEEKNKSASYTWKNSMYDGGYYPLTYENIEEALR